MKRTLPLLMLCSALLAACGQQTPAPQTPAPAARTPGSGAAATSLSLRLPYFPRLDPAAGPQAQYVNAAATTRLGVVVDGGPEQSLTSPALSCVQADAACTAALKLTPGGHSLTLTTYGGNNAISQASLTVTVLEGQANLFSVTLKPLNLTASLSLSDPAGSGLLTQPDGSSVLAQTGSYALNAGLKDAVGGSVPLAGNATVCSDSGALNPSNSALNTSGFTASDAQLWVVAGSDCAATRLSSLKLHAEGSLKWHVSLAPGAQPTAALALGTDGTVYVPSGDGRLYALKPDGSLKWASGPLGNSLVNAPAIGADGTVYVAAEASLYALDPASGAQKWQATPGSLIYASPSVASDGTVYIGTLDGKLYAVNPTSGAATQKFDTSSSADRRIYAGVVLAMAPDGTIFISALDSDQDVGNDELFAVNPGSGQRKWGAPLHLTYASPAVGTSSLFVPAADDLLRSVNPASGAVEWSSGLTNQVSNASPVLDSAGNVYVTSDSGQLYSFTAAGAQRWAAPVGTSADAAPLVGRDQTVYVVSANRLSAFKPDGTLRWSNPAVPGWRFGNTGFDLSPAIASDGSGVLYTGADDGGVYAVYSLSDGLSAGSWPKAHHDNRNTGQD